MGGSLSSLLGEEYQVVKRGMEYHGCGEEYNVESNIIIPKTFRLSGRRGSGRKSIFKKMRVGKNIEGTIYTPALMLDSFIISLTNA